ncbi:MAG: sterol desaturase family protein [Amphiplicatus sp.]
MEYLKGVNGLIFLALVVTFAAALETWRPWRRQGVAGPVRWARAAGLNAYGVVALSLLPFMSGYGLSLAAEAKGLGLLNMIAFPLWAQIAITLVVFDFAAVLQPASLPRWGFLWRAHRAHHSDVRIDAATSLRFHPLETVFRAAIEAPFTVLFGVPPEGVLVAFAVIVIVNVYTHANIAWPKPLERALAPYMITPRMHRLHHTTDENNQHTNYGVFLALWDRMLGSWRGADSLGEDDAFGLRAPEAPERETFGALLLDPARSLRTAARAGQATTAEAHGPPAAP